MILYYARLPFVIKMKYPRGWRRTRAKYWYPGPLQCLSVGAFKLPQIAVGGADGIDNIDGIYNFDGSLSQSASDTLRTDFENYLIGTPQRASTARKSLSGGNTSLFQSAPCASCARCSYSTMSLSSRKIFSVNQVTNGHTA
jgi:hypothetical protein